MARHHPASDSSQRDGQFTPLLSPAPARRGVPPLKQVSGAQDEGPVASGTAKSFLDRNPCAAGKSQFRRSCESIIPFGELEGDFEAAVNGACIPTVDRVRRSITGPARPGLHLARGTERMPDFALPKHLDVPDLARRRANHLLGLPLAPDRQHQHSRGGGNGQAQPGRTGHPRFDNSYCRFAGWRGPLGLRFGGSHQSAGVEPVHQKSRSLANV